MAQSKEWTQHTPQAGAGSRRMSGSEHTHSSVHEETGQTTTSASDAGAVQDSTGMSKHPNKDDRLSKEATRNNVLKLLDQYAREIGLVPPETSAATASHGVSRTASPDSTAAESSDVYYSIPSRQSPGTSPARSNTYIGRACDVDGPSRQEMHREETRRKEVMTDQDMTEDD